jgi:hypothetical protein
MRLLLVLLALTLTSHAQWEIQNSGTTASLRGIDNVGNGVAWASGTGGTVLKTEDGGKHWQVCAVPPGAEKLDFRGVQAFDAKTAIVMSSGKGDLSRLYKTTDGCAMWKLVFTNPDKDGFWDAIQFAMTIPRDSGKGFLLGDPVNGAFRFFETDDEGTQWNSLAQRGIEADSAVQGSFAASNTGMEALDAFPLFTSGGSGGAFVYINTSELGCPEFHCGTPESQTRIWRRFPVPVGRHTSSSGIFSIGVRYAYKSDRRVQRMIAVGGDYKRPEDSKDVAAFSFDTGRHWLPAKSSPHGYRSAVAYDANARAWITVGPNGTDVSFDDGKDWKPLTPGAGDAPDADKNWNALSLPFVVGPKGRIGVLKDGVLK